MPHSTLKNCWWLAVSWLLLHGCGPKMPATDPALPDEVTFTAHIAPLLHTHCAPCHRPGGAGPFSLITYQDVAKRAKMVARVTADRYMPPWPADPEYSHFLGEKVLSDREIALIDRWAKTNRLPGDTAKTAVPDFVAVSGLGKPDLVIWMPDSVPITGDNRDRFLFMKMPFELPRDTFVRAIAFIPGNKRAVHHMNGHLVSYTPGTKTRSASSVFYVNREEVAVEVAYPQLGLLQDDGRYPALTPLVCSYLPGMEVSRYPDGIGGFRLPRQGVFLLNDMHYGPVGIDTFDYSRFEVYYAPAPPKRPTHEIQLGTLGISAIVPPLVIPPDTVMTFRTRAVIQQDISLLSVNPHMHLLGKSFLAYAILPQGDTLPLIRIPRWDFRWQYTYTYPRMVRLPKGTRIEVEGIFDNTADNPANPFSPPQTVSERDGSMRTTDEMLQFILTYLPYEVGDEQRSLER